MRRWGIWALIGCAIVVKASYLLAYAELPFLLGPIGDSTVYLAQAAAVRDGRFGDPTLLAFSPLYGYFLAVFPSPGSLVVLQLLLGTANLGLIYWVLERRFGWRAALLSAVFYFGYGLVLFYETKVLSETLGLSLALWATLAFLSGSFRNGRSVATVGTGALVGFAVLARASLVFGVPFFAVAAFAPWAPTDGWGERVRRTLGLVVGVSLVLGSYGVWTKVHAGTFVVACYATPSTSHLSRTTADDWDGHLADVGFRGRDALPNAWDVVDAVARDVSRKRSNARSDASDLLDTIGGIDIGGWLSGAPGKIWTTLSDTERTFQYGYYAERENLTALRSLPFTFHVLLCFGVLGAFFLARDEGLSALWPYVPWFLGCLITVTLYHPSSRYRLGTAVPLVLLAGWGFEQFVLRARAQRRWILVAAVALFCLVSIARTMTYTLRNPARWEITQAASWVSRGVPEEVERHSQRAIELAPDDPRVRQQTEHLRNAVLGRSPTPVEPP